MASCELITFCSGHFPAFETPYMPSGSLGLQPSVQKQPSFFPDKDGNTDTQYDTDNWSHSTLFSPCVVQQRN